MTAPPASPEVRPLPGHIRGLIDNLFRAEEAANALAAQPEAAHD